jgi:hypothetical protein
VAGWLNRRPGVCIARCCLRQKSKLARAGRSTGPGRLGGAGYRTRAAAGIGSACGPGAGPTPDLRESARDAPRMRKYRRAARLGCNGAQWPPGVRQQQPQALLEDTGLQSRPTPGGSTETPTTTVISDHTDAHVCANGPISHLFSRSIPASSKLQLRT